MLKIKIDGDEFWDEETQEFKETKALVLYLEHSLVSISKWESIYHKPFFSKNEKTTEETIGYIKCMVMNDDFEFDAPLYLPNKIIAKIDDYINDPYTATWFGKNNKNNKKSKNHEQITSELVYYWMIALNIPMECERWHFNRLLTLIEVCNIKNEKPKKMSNKEIYSRNSALNEIRRRQMNTHG